MFGVERHEDGIYAQVRDIRIYYEREGKPHAAPLLLISGQGAQLTSWHPNLRAGIIQAGFQLITFDNRDVGLSSKCESPPHYELGDMADDAAGLLHALHIPAAHIVGQSMGGMIAQQLALDHPQHVLRLCSIYSAPSPAYITSDPDVWNIREQPPATGRDAAIAQFIEHERLSGLAQYTEEWIQSYAETTIDRCYYPQGGHRQMAAIRRSADRTDRLTNLKIPTAVLHGLDDGLIGAAGGIATAAAVPKAELHLYADMGHQLLPSLWEDYIRVITRNAARAPTWQD